MIICGVDEVGRGSWSGPMLAVGVLVEAPSPTAGLSLADSPILGIKDSKKILPKRRAELFKEILKYSGVINFIVAEATVEDINKYGIHYANKMVFLEILAKAKADVFYIDGSIKVEHPKVPVYYGPKYDNLYWPVAMASILAKEIRDSFMVELDREHPSYNWKSNMGYGTADHIKGVKEFGITKFHRTLFVSDYV